MKIVVKKIRTSLHYGFLALILSFVLEGRGDNADFHASGFQYYMHHGFSFFIGVFIGIAKEFLGFNSLSKRPFFIRIIAQIAIIEVFSVLIIMGLAILASVSEYQSASIGALNFLFSPDYLDVFVNILFFVVFILFFIELESLLGRNFVYHYLTGKYNRPKHEKRVFMFIDLQNSTQIAEQLGDELFYNLLNDCYRTLTSPVLLSDAEIVKYIGDEVVLTWTVKKGFKHNNCIEFYFRYCALLNKKAAYFEKKYGVFPIFKAGLHGGDVMTAYLGELKRQLDFSGDVMNTTARIQSMCSQLSTNFLVSKFIYDSLANKDKYHAKAFENIELKGKQQKLDLFELKQQ